jgi:hypothetical protein
MTEDLAKAREIVNRRRAWVGKAGALRSNIEAAVVEGIAFGRQQGLAHAIKLVEEAAQQATDDLDRVGEETSFADNMKVEDWVRKA